MNDRDDSEIGTALQRFEPASADLAPAPRATAMIDIQIATARQYPRSIKRFLSNATTMATLTPEIAAGCCYAKPVGKDFVRGPSVRLAEIVYQNWGHLEAGARVIEQDARFLVAQGYCFDLETNVRNSVEVKRRITDRNGRTYSDDMIVNTANAACSIAFRNAIFRVVPRVLVDQIMARCNEVSRGGMSVAELRVKTLAHFASLAVSPARIFARLGVAGREDITLDHVDTLRGIATAIQDGEIKVDDAFPEPVAEGVAGAVERARAGTGTKSEVLAEVARAARERGKWASEPPPEPPPTA
jgi:hypothetical protein